MRETIDADHAKVRLQQTENEGHTVCEAEVSFTLSDSARTL